MREEARIDVFEFVHCEVAVRAVLEKSLVPFLELVFVEFCCLHEVLNDFWPQFAVCFTHSCRERGEREGERGGRERGEGEREGE